MSGPRSITLHGIGGIGKTQIALEYSFRYRSHYSAVFWVAAESELTMTASFSEVARKLAVGQSEKTARGIVQAAKDWLEMNADWLLIFDNADDVEMVRKVWPQGLAGSIVVTSQNLDFVNFTSGQVHVESLSDDDGATYVMKDLRRGESDRQPAKALCEELGGMPLAISHITGYAFRANLGVDEVLETLKQRRRQIHDVWTAKGGSVYYPKPLDTVWDLAISALPPAALNLLDVLAFLNPDAVDEAIILGSKDVLNLGSDHETRATGLRSLVYNLRERHLIERDEREGVYYLRMHRSFRRNLLHHLDDNLGGRQTAFNQAYTAVREVFPQISFVSRTERLWPAVQRYLPQVLSLHACYRDSDPHPIASIDFADLLCDAGTFLWEQNIVKDSMPLLYTAEQVCEELVQPGDPNPVYAQVLESIAVFEDLLGLNLRRKSVVRMHKVQQLRLDYYDRIPSGQRTQYDEITLCRSWSDTAASLIGLYQVDQAAILYERSAVRYRQIGDEDDITYRFAHLNYDLTMLRVCQNRLAEALQCGERAYELGCKALTATSPWVLTFKFIWACAVFTSGNFSEALRLHREVLDDRLQILKTTSADTLLSHYYVGTIYFYMDEYEHAEYHLDEALKARHRADWHAIEVARTAQRLVMVLSAQKRYKAAEDVEEDLTLFPQEAQPEAVCSGLATSVEARMEAYDFEVSLWHGRTEGLCKPRNAATTRSSSLTLI